MVTEIELQQADKRMKATAATRAVAARFDRRASRVVIRLNTGLELAFPPAMAEGLGGATAEDLSEIEISPAGLGLHWPRLDADLYVPALLKGAFGSRQWMAAQLGAVGGRARSAAKVASARENGRKGGRPPRTAAG